MHDPVSIDSIESLYGAVERNPQANDKALLMLWLRSWLNRVSSFDPISGLALHTGLDEIGSVIYSLVGDDTLENYSEDRIHRIITHSMEAIISVMGHAREKIIREHAMLPIHAAMEVDSKSVQWLGRKPGRTIREKLAGKPYIKAVRRKSTVDTAENQLMKALMIRLEQVLDKRQSVLNLKPGELSEELHVAIQRWTRSEEASNIGAWNNLSPNNILLQDKLYRKIWDAWLWVQGIDESIKADADRISKDALSVVFWETIAQLNNYGFFRFVQQPVAIDYHDFRITPGSEIQGCFFPPSELKFKGVVKYLHPRGKNGRIVSESGTDLYFNNSNLGYNIEFSSLAVGTSVEFNIVRNKAGKCADGIILSRRGVSLKISRVEDEYHISTVDVHICIKIKKNQLIVQHGDLKREYGLTPFNLKDAPKTVLSMILGDFQSTTHIISESSPRQFQEHCIVDLCSIRPKYSKQVGIQERLPFRFLLQQWLSRGKEKSMIDCGVSKAIKLSSDIEAISMKTLFESKSGLTNADRSDASMTFAKKLYDHITSDSLTYLIPDWVNDFEMEGIRKSINFHFGSSTPLPRSIAAVFAWQASKTFAKSRVSQNDILLVIDSKPSGYSLTPLEARYHQDLKKILPGTSGFYWERHPTTTVEVSGIDESFVRFLSNDGCPHPEEIIRLFGRDGLKSDGTWLSVLVNDEWYHIPEISQHLLENVIDPFVISEQSINETINTIAGKLQTSNVYVITLDDTIKVPSSDRSYKVMKENLSVVEGGQILNQWQKEAGDIPLWRDHLPELSIRIVQQGHFEDFYLVKDAAVTPQRGSRVDIPVEESFTLPAGQNHYSFPLQQGEGTRELQYVAYLKSPAFPLAKDTNCRLRMTYTYGADDPYELKFIPEESSKAGFVSVPVEWRPVSADSKIEIQSLPVPDFPTRKSWSEFQSFPRDDGTSYSNLLDWVKADIERICDNANFLSGLESTRLYDDQIGHRWNWNADRNEKQFCTLSYPFGVVFFHESNFDEFTPNAESISFSIEKQRDRDGYVARDISLGKSISERLSKHFRKSLRFPALTIWNQGHSIEDDEAPQSFRDSVCRGIESAQNICFLVDAPESVKTQLFFFLCCLQKDAPDSVANQLLLAVKDKDLFRKHCWDIAYAIGEAELPWQQELFVNVINPIDNEGLTRSIALEILAIAFWRSESLIRLLTEDELVTLTKSTIGCLQFDINKATNAGPGYHLAVLGRHLELLLALLRSRGSTDAECKMILAPGNKIVLECIAIVDEVTKVVIDNKLRLQSRINLHIEKPEMFKNTPDLLYALRMYLTGDSGANTISVTAVSDE